MKFLLKIGMFLTLLALATQTFAGEAPGNLQVLSASDNSISLDWDDVDQVIGYYIYYGTQTGSGSSYDIEGIDLIDESELVLSDLEADTRYYIALTSVDEFGTESEYSDEVEYVTLQQGAAPESVSFRISDVEIINETSIELIFSTDLETGISATREFIIEDENTGREISVDISDVLEGQLRNVIVVLGEELDPESEYKVTVLDISDAAGNTIESGIDAFINFTTPSVFTVELESAGPEVVEPVIEEEDEVVVEEVQDEVVEEVTSEVVGNNAGTTISTTDNTLSAAEDNEKLPQTGPEHWLLAFIALMLAGGVYYVSSRKES